MTASALMHRLSAVPLILLCLSDPAAAGLFSDPDNYHECLLEELEGAQNDVAAIQATLQCREEFPSLAMPEEKRSSFLFGPDTFSECVQSYAGSTPSQYAAPQLRQACFVLYRQDEN